MLISSYDPPTLRRHDSQPIHSLQTFSSLHRRLIARPTSSSHFMDLTKDSSAWSTCARTGQATS